MVFNITCVYGSSSHVFGSWEQKSCPSYAICVPDSHGDGGVCHCAFTTDLLEESSTGCVSSSSSYVMMAVWVFLSVLSFAGSVVSLITMMRFRRRIANRDSASLTQVLLFLSFVTLTLHLISRVLFALALEGLWNFVWLFFLISQTVFGVK